MDKPHVWHGQPNIRSDRRWCTSVMGLAAVAAMAAGCGDSSSAAQVYTLTKYAPGAGSQVAIDKTGVYAVTGSSDTVTPLGIPCQVQLVSDNGWSALLTITSDSDSTLANPVYLKPGNYWLNSSCIRVKVENGRGVAVYDITVTLTLE